MDLNKGTITRRMDSVLDDLEKEFQSMYTKFDFEQKIDQLKKGGNKSSRLSILRELFDMFDDCDIQYKIGQDNEYYEKLVEELDIPEDYKGLEDQLIYKLYQRYQEYPTPEEFLNRIVNRLMFKEDHWESDTLRVKILKQFVKYGNCLTYEKPDESDNKKSVKVKIYGGEKYICKYLKEKTGKKKIDLIKEVECIDDEIFLVLDKASKDQKKPTGKYGLIKMVDDLANAKFRAEGATKRSLYLFAMVYDMTYYSGDSSEIVDYATDIEINLFQDYYSNNLMRFISDTYKGHLSEFELNPSGRGINYKNFAEMIYLYFISKNYYTPQEKIKLSNEMIERVQHEKVQKGVTTQGTDPKGTMYYRRLARIDNSNEIFSEDILNLPEKEFEQFICENYNCDTNNKGYVVSPMQLNTEQNTAYQEYKLIVGERELKEDQLYGLWFSDVKEFKKREYKRIYNTWPGIDKDKFSDFMELIVAIDAYLKEPLNKTKDTITRSAMIEAYYYDFNSYHFRDDDTYGKSFEDVYSDFKEGIDTYLEKSFYQPFSSKNIFDVLVAFSAYSYINM